MARRKWRGLSRERRLELLKQQCGICPYCGCTMTLNRADWPTGKYATVEHVTPWSVDDQPPSEQVVVLCCRSCNTKKADRPLLPFLLDLHNGRL